METGTFERINFLVAFLTEVLIPFFKHIALDKGIESFLQIFLIHDRYSHIQEVLRPDIAVRTRLTNNLIGKRSTKVVLNRLLLGSPFNGAFEFVHEHVQVFFDVHLLEGVDRLSLPVLE